MNEVQRLESELARLIVLCDMLHSNEAYQQLVVVERKLARATAWFVGGNALLLADRRSA